MSFKIIQLKQITLRFGYYQMLNLSNNCYYDCDSFQSEHFDQNRYDVRTNVVLKKRKPSDDINI